MSYEEREHAGRYYGVQFMYAVPESAWFVELSDVKSGTSPEPWACPRGRWASDRFWATPRRANM
jgi:hypothetical protein